MRTDDRAFGAFDRTVSCMCVPVPYHHSVEESVYVGVDELVTEHVIGKITNRDAIGDALCQKALCNCDETNGQMSQQHTHHDLQ